MIYLFLIWVPIAISEPLAENHNDFYNIEDQFEVVIGPLEQANISVKGLFLNTDTGFDAKDFRKSCDSKDINVNIFFNKRNGNTDRYQYFDQGLNNQKCIIELTNAWIDSLQSLLNRFEATVASWLEITP